MTEGFPKPATPPAEKTAPRRRGLGAAALPFTLAAPSFVIPAGVAENARFLADHYAEISLLFFETRACLAYTDADLPPHLAGLPVDWHVHLPLDLPWERGPDAAWEAIARLMDKAAFLRPWAWVLHPPAAPGLLADLAGRLRRHAIDPADVLLENVAESDLCALWAEARAEGFSACLDLGHILAHDQHAVLDLPGVWEATRMLHVCAPGPGGRHLSLTRLDDAGRALLEFLYARFTGRTVTLEVFDKTGLFESTALLERWLTHREVEK
ncbi:MAG: cobamide remodeling phosphodiesterase CbiR [Pseudomonadota bacterium]